MLNILGAYRFTMLTDFLAHKQYTYAELRFVISSIYNYIAEHKINSTKQNIAKYNIIEIDRAIYVV